MKKILYTLIAITFATYWALTIFINLPEESLAVGENYRLYDRLNRLMYQKWSFFAPPPKSNKRLHYIFVESDGKQYKIHDVEIFERFSNIIKEKYLLNDLHVNTTWTVFNYTERINEDVRKAYNLYLIQTKCKGDSCYDVFFEKYKPLLYKSGYMKFLVNHAKGIAKNAKLSPDCKLIIKISEIDIPKYADRYKKNAKQNEKLIFRSDLYNLKMNKWEQ
jgi:hypothetical protein